MKNPNQKKISDFLKSQSLYSKIKLLSSDEDSGNYSSIYDFFEGKAYKYYCPIEKEEHTFKIDEIWGQRHHLRNSHLPDTYLDFNNKFNFSLHLMGRCQSCDFKMDFLLNIFSKQEIIDENSLPDLYVRKIGQFPAVERSPEREVFEYLTAEDKENYKKALSNLSVSYGIGAFAYFRRIIENEIKRIILDISELDFDGSENIKAAIHQFKQNHQMSNLIKAITPYIPKSLKENGVNLINLLYKQLSGGIHEFSEEVCLEKAKKIDVILRYVIKKVNSEKYDLKLVKEAMKELE